VKIAESDYNTPVPETTDFPTVYDLRQRRYWFESRAVLSNVADNADDVHPFFCHRGGPQLNVLTDRILVTKYLASARLADDCDE